jgi:tol-pal system protein YbgF
MPYPSKLACNFGLLGLIVSLASGCTGGQNQLKSRLSELERELTSVQNRSDRLEERLAAVELNQATLERTAPTAEQSEPASGRPQLSVVHLGPDKADSSPAIDARSDEPEEAPIRISDDGSGEAWAEADGVRVVGTGASPQAGSDRLPAAIHDYQAALELVKAKAYPRALEAFEAFLRGNPHHPYADNALYWRGECFYALSDFQQAKREFALVVERYPDGNKAPDALLKLGMAQLKLGETKQARETFARLSQNYPKSEASRKVSDRSGSQ